MRQTAIHPPRTIMEVHQILPEGTRCEIIDGGLIMSPAPILNHQVVISKIFGEMFAFLKSNPVGTALVSPVDVYFDEKNVCQPDIVFVSHKRSNILKPDGIHGAPDLLVEILSPSNKGHDLVTKKNLYAKFDVGEYWIVDPTDKQAIGYQLVGNEFVEFLRSNSKMHSIVLNVTIDF